MKRIAAIFLLLAGVTGSAALTVTPAEAGRFRVFVPNLQLDLAQSSDGGDYGNDGGAGGADIAIRPREAAQIARGAVPGAKVLNVRLLPSGIYAVTLRGDGKLTRVMVDGRSGNIL